MTGISAFEGVTAQFRGDLDEIRRNLEFARTAFKILPKVGEILSLVAGSEQLRLLMEEFKQQKVNELNSLYQGLYVQLCASFEWFMRKLVSACIDELCQSKPPYEILADRRSQLLSQNVYHTGIALQQIYDNRSNAKLDFHALSKNIATAIPGSTAVVLNSAAFALFLGQPDASSITKAMKRIGVTENFWDRVGSSGDIQRLFGENRARHAGNAAQDFINEFMMRRNNIAHRGDAIVPVTDSDILLTADFLQSLATCLVTIVQRYCRP